VDVRMLDKLVEGFIRSVIGNRQTRSVLQDHVVVVGAGPPVGIRRTSLSRWSRRSGGGAPYLSSAEAGQTIIHRARPQTALATALRSIALFERTLYPSMSPAVRSVPALQRAAVSLWPARKGSNRWPGVKAPARKRR